MGAFTHNTLLWIRVRRQEGYTVQRLCDINPQHTRDEIIEAIDALRRNETITGAQRHVNHVLALQAAGEPLINGNPQTSVARNWFTPRPTPMF